MIQLIYSSIGTVPFTPDDLCDLLMKSRRNNSRAGITGMLLYHDGTFLQVLEGEEASVQETFERISRDHRHSRILLLQKRETQVRSFDGWEMGFCDTSEHKAHRLPGFSSFLHDRFSDDSFLRHGDKARSVLVRFKHGAWHRAVNA